MGTLTRYCEKRIMMHIVDNDIGQLVAAAMLAFLNKERPIMATEGAIVNGVMYLSIMPMIPKYPMMICNKDETQMAPCTSLIRICHSSVRFSELRLAYIGVPKSAGHLLCSRAKMAKVGAMKVKVPPCTMGNLEKKLVCNSAAQCIGNFVK